MTPPPRVIAEIGQGKGSVDYIIEAATHAAQAGCWGAKIQLLQPDRIAQADAAVYWDERRPEIRGQRDTFETVGCLDYFELHDIAEAAHDLGVALLATPFDLDAVEAAAKAGLEWCKIASGDITYRALIEAAAEAFPGKVIVSTGASTLAEIERATDWIAGASGRDPHALLACSLAYPTPNAKAELSRITTLARHIAAFGLDTVAGYSDHTYLWYSARAAVGAGAQVLEKHFTLNPEDRSVPDNEFALPPNHMARYVMEAHRAAEMMGTGDLTVTDAEEPARVGARRCICAMTRIRAGQRISEGLLTCLRPATPGGFEPWETDQVVGRFATADIAAGRPVLRSHIA